MKKLLFAVLSFAFISAQAQTADDVINKFSANLGGLDAFNKITSAKITGSVTAQGSDFPLTTQIINSKGFRTDIEIMGSSVINCYFNGNGWKVNQFAGAPSPTPVTGNELSEFKAQSFLASPLMDYKVRGHQVELQGEEDVEGVKTFKIKLTNKDDGKVTTYFIAVADYTLIKSISNREMRGQEVEVETFYSNIKEFGGIKFIMSRSQRIEGQEFQAINFENVELNVTIDEKIFNMPK